MPQLGQLTLTALQWTGRHALTATVATPRDDLYVQLYAGRTLIGVAGSPGSARVTGQVIPSRSPFPMTVVLVETDDRFTDFGARIPRRPWNQYRLRWDADGIDADTRWFAIAQGDAPEAAADFAEMSQRVPYFAGLDEYAADLLPFDQSGDWSVGVCPLDDALPDGNAGEPLLATIAAVVFPPDVEIDELGERLAVDVADGELTVSYTLPW